MLIVRNLFSVTILLKWNFTMLQAEMKPIIVINLLKFLFLTFLFHVFTQKNVPSPRQMLSYLTPVTKYIFIKNLHYQWSWSIRLNMNNVAIVNAVLIIIPKNSCTQQNMDLTQLPVDVFLWFLHLPLWPV